MKRLTVAMALAFGVGGCGDHLGEYRLEDVRTVQQIPAEALDYKRRPDTSRYIRVELSSLASLYAANTGPGLYTDADFCPLRDPYRLIAFAPLATDGKPVEDSKRDEELKPQRDGRYHYFVYLASNSPRRKLWDNSKDFVPAYDLRQGGRDVCVRFYVPGYNIIKSRSDIVRIPAKAIAEALDAET